MLAKTATVVEHRSMAWKPILHGTLSCDIERLMPELFRPPVNVLNKTHLRAVDYDRLYRWSIENPEAFWAKQAEEFLSWFSPWETVLDWDYTRGHIEWFKGGKINVCYNCVDRHAALTPDKVAIIWEANSPGDVTKITYAELHAEVVRMAAVLERQSVRQGDRVAIYLPMIPRLPITMLACARIGAIHSVVFAGFSSEALRSRLIDSGAQIVITANESARGTKIIPLKEIVDGALQGTQVRRVLVERRTASATGMLAGRDLWLDEEFAKPTHDVPCAVLDSEASLFMLYTSGSTGRPKGVLHTQAGYLLYTAFTHKYVFDYQPDDVYFCAADIGWITGHSYIVYGPLANGATTIMFESIPTYPDAGRYWDMVERHKVSIFYTAPTAIRAIAKEGDQFVKRYDRSSLRVLGSVGEPINRDAWLWYHNVVGERRCALVDTWWQTETGGILISPLPGATSTKPGSATRPLFGIQPAIVDDGGNEILGNEVKGRLCIKFPWPGQMRTVYGDHKRFVDTYFRQVPGMYFTGDAAERDLDGYYWIRGRVDDVLNVSGHRLGTAELESAIVSSGIVAEAAVVAMPHEIKGQGIFAFCILRIDAPSPAECREQIIRAVKQAIGVFAAPDKVVLVPGLPKTRSGKIMRRILRKIAEGQTDDLGDITTLADPGVVDDLVQAVSRIYSA